MTTSPASDARFERTIPVPQGDRYRAEGWWDAGPLAVGIERAAEERPEALAVADNEVSLTYRELAGRIEAARARLRAAGVEEGDGVVLVAGNTVGGVVAYHALLRAGATVALLDRRCGRAEVGWAVDALGGAPSVIVPVAEGERLCAGSGRGWLALEALTEAGSANGSAAEWVEPGRGRAAVMLFTSGTTSRPKAVLHSLNTLGAGAANFVRITGADAESVVFLVSPLTSITGVMQLHLAADRHASLVLEDRFGPDSSLERINRLGATLLGGAPVIVERLLEAAARLAEPRIALRTLALGGAMLPRPLLELATDRFGMEIARVYGSSEAPNFSGSRPEDGRRQRLADDGALMPGSEVRIGSAGHSQEALLRGPSVCLGYADPDDHAAAFEDGWLRTGDLLEVNEGRLTVIGRLKDVVNRNGLKISLSEIDAALSGLPGVREHACFAVADPTTGERLAVAVRLEDGASVTLEDVVGHLLAAGVSRRKLPERLVCWDGPLPRTPSGKVIRSRLGAGSSTT